MSAELTKAIAAWTDVLGADHVRADATSLAAAATATFATTQQALAILRPADREQVQACLRIANRLDIPVYPYSSGKNWGYGSRVPSQDAALLDLGRLNRILDFDEELAYVTVEPGVTQAQLFAFLQETGSRLWMDATGASPDCSIVGNTLERGFGHTPMGDHAGNACGLEVVLPTGDCIETGFSRFTNSRVGPLGRPGVGPSLDGLFSQSNLGIVTRMTVWLMPAPEHFEAFFFLIRREAGLEPVINALRPLRLDGTLRSIMHIGNDYKVVAGSSQYPWQEMGDRVPLDAAAITRIRERLGIGRWNGSGGLYGTKAQVREAKRRLRRALKGNVDRLQFVDDRLLDLLKRFARPARRLVGWDVERTLDVLDPVYHLLKGVPTSTPLASTYWRKRTAPPASPDPDRDGCGLLWCSPVVPNTGHHLTEAARLATSIVLEHGFEPQMSISLATERSAICVITISYDRDVAGQDDAAQHCYRALTSALTAAGYPPYRLNVSGMDLIAGHPDYDATLRALKTALDPKNILAPGRYDASDPSSPRLPRLKTSER